MSGGRVFVEASLLVVVMVLASCATSPTLRPAGEPDESVTAAIEESAELRDAMESGVDFDSYLAGFQRFSACLESEGYGLVVHDADPPVVDYSIPEAAVDAGAEERCYIREFAPLDSAWQVANEDSSEWAEILRRCLGERGLAPADSLVDMEAQRTAADISPEECLIG